MGRKIAIALALLGATTLGVLVLALKAEVERTLGPKFGGRPPIDPASPTYEGRENRDWDELRSNERMDRAERAIAAVLVERTDVDARARAWMVLSAARAEFFSTEAGARRYLELEQALVNAQSATQNEN
jgi:hypothetical protein